MGKLRWRDRGAAARADDCGIRTESCLKRADPSNFDHSGGLAKFASWMQSLLNFESTPDPDLHTITIAPCRRTSSTERRCSIVDYLWPYKLCHVGLLHHGRPSREGL